MFYAPTRRPRPKSWRGIFVVLASATLAGMPAVSFAQAPQDQSPPPPASAPASPQQEQQQPPPPPQQQQPASQQQTITSADVTDVELEQFAKSVEDVVQIQEETEKRLEGLTDTAEMQKLQTEANQRMAKAIQEHGMKVERFNLIARAVNQDPELKQRLQETMQALRQPPA